MIPTCPNHSAGLKWLVPMAAVLLGGMPAKMKGAETTEDLKEKGHKQWTQAAHEEVRVLLIGDSTVCTYPLNNPTRGWGQMLPEFFNDQVTLLNTAVGGRSSKSFWNEGRWAKAKEFQPDFVFIQFGHNDQPGKGPERETDPRTTYRDYLLRYIQESRCLGAEPILVTPVARRTFRNGHVVSSLGPWAEEVIAVGKENGVPVIDLHSQSMALYEQLGDEGSADYSTPQKGDRTHFSEKGARAMAAMVVADVRQTVPDLASYLKNSAGVP